MVAHANLGFEDEAFELAKDEHFTLSRQLEELREEAHLYRRGWIGAWKEDNGYHEDVAEYFNAHRQHFLEQASELFAEEVAL